MSLWEIRWTDIKFAAERETELPVGQWQNNCNLTLILRSSNLVLVNRLDFITAHIYRNSRYVFLSFLVMIKLDMYIIPTLCVRCEILSSPITRGLSWPPRFHLHKRKLFCVAIFCLASALYDFPSRSVGCTFFSNTTRIWSKCIFIVASIRFSYFTTLLDNANCNAYIHLLLTYAQLP